MTEKTRDALAIVSVALSATAIIGAVAFWAGGLDTRIRERLTELAPEEADSTQGIVEEPSTRSETADEDPARVIVRMDFANTVRWGEWSEPMYCPANHYVCGLAQKAEPGRGSGTDDTAVNGIAFYCCPLPVSP